MIGFVLAAIALGGCLFATWSDIKTKEIPNELNLLLILAGIYIRTYHVINTGDHEFITTPLVVALLYFLGSAVLYYSCQWGGGDVKLLIAIGCLLGTFPQEFFHLQDYLGFEILPGAAAAGIPKVAGNPQCLAPCIDPPWPFWTTMLFNIMFVGAVYGLMAALYLGLRNPKAITELKRTVRRDEKELVVVLVGCAIFILLVGYGLTNTIDLSYLARSWPLYIQFAFMWFLIKFAHIIQDVTMKREVPVDELQEEDWIDEDVIVDEPVFAWGEIPGKAAEAALLDHLRMLEGVELAGKATVKKKDDIITIEAKGRKLTLTLEDKGGKAVLREKRSVLAEYVVREEDDDRSVVTLPDREVASTWDPGVSQEQIDEIVRLAKEGRFKDTIRIKEGVPFAPVFPLAVLVSLVFGDVIFLIILRYSI
ncbi:MAG: prepilin peptidase [Candidatus Undinarchaeales archaeon]|jgi:preflagellin peptidase FlaK|nr:prepilin peptidase [Candidatus Undinarchaeales archaeon]MDP7493737.1 prepilin peptidase [Candidatus Undinarchaeales archaeon]